MYPALRFSYDDEADAAYVSLERAEVMQPSVERTVPVQESINLDFGGDGQLVGVEILNASKLLSTTMVRQGNIGVEEWRLLLNALNEILHGPNPIEDWEFHTRTGWHKDDAAAVLTRLRGNT